MNFVTSSTSVSSTYFSALASISSSSSSSRSSRDSASYWIYASWFIPSCHNLFQRKTNLFLCLCFPSPINSVNSRLNLSTNPSTIAGKFHIWVYICDMDGFMRFLAIFLIIAIVTKSNDIIFVLHFDSTDGPYFLFN